MSEATINALMAIFLVAFLVIVTAIMVVGGVIIIWEMVTAFIDAIQEREDGSEE